MAKVLECCTKKTRNHISNLEEDEALLSKILEQFAVQKSGAQETTFYMAKCMGDVGPNLNIIKQIILTSKERSQKMDPLTLRDRGCSRSGKKLVEQFAQSQEAPGDTSSSTLKCLLHENFLVYIELFPRDVIILRDQAKLIIEHAHVCIEETKNDAIILEHASQSFKKMQDIQFPYCLENWNNK
ncbi:unnamed protein product [Ceutorhynchus assimilis]|uniref:Uncharacterized protein n=1 Tax=Ceutorhynchus assimilis TaxID=467358 RepID=A0A9N9QMY7_9CUCU|nr:unnamed protein product [Ceutorhynchus assimilis]